MEEAREAAERGDYQTALAIWGPLAHAGVPRAQNNIGACFAEGLGVERDPALALRWLTLAAEAGDPVGQRNLAALHFKGDGVAQSDERGPAAGIALRPRRAMPPAQDMLVLDASGGRRRGRSSGGAALGRGRGGSRRRAPA